MNPYLAARTVGVAVSIVPDRRKAVRAVRPPLASPVQSNVGRAELLDQHAISLRLKSTRPWP